MPMSEKALIQYDDSHKQSANTYIVVIPDFVKATIDCIQLNVEEKLQISENLNRLERKTKDNIVFEANQLRYE